MTESEFDDVLARLSLEYRDGLGARLIELDRLWDAVRAQPGAIEALRELHLHFHYFAGSGGSFGMPELSEQATVAENTVSPALRAGRGLNADELATVATQVEILRGLIEAGQIMPPAADSSGVVS